MKRAERAVERLRGALEGRDILEVACGCGEFSIRASKIAASVHCIDLDGGRLLPEAAGCGNLTFSEMDAAALRFADEAFDAVVIYNAIGHLARILDEALRECLRVLRPGGSLWFVSSFRMDRRAIAERLIPLLENRRDSYQIAEEAPFLYVKIEKGGNCS